MKIAVINEVSARAKNPYIINALKNTGHSVYNIGMTDGEVKTELTYLHTGLMAALSLNLGAADFVIGGCGTGQGFLISAMQYPNVYCGLIQSPLDAFLFSRINDGNCISLALNKGFGWASEVDLQMIIKQLFTDAKGGGYPPERSQSQAESRKALCDVSLAVHKNTLQIIQSLKNGLLKQVVNHKPFTDFILEYAKIDQSLMEFKKLL